MSHQDSLVGSLAAGGSTDPIDVLVIHGHGLIQAAIRTCLADCRDIRICAEVSHPGGLAQLTAAADPQVIVVDGLIADLDPAELRPALARYERSRPGILVLVEAGDEMPQHLQRLARASAIPVRVTPEQLRCAVRLIAAGYLITGADPARPGPGTGPDARAVAENMRGLSSREYDVLSLLACGQSNAQIARDLSLSESTIKTHVQSLLKKLDAPSRLCAVIYA
jgi:DNA-binding NarL/FixJ family response regulator